MVGVKRKINEREINNKKKKKEVIFSSSDSYRIDIYQYFFKALGFVSAE